MGLLNSLSKWPTTTLTDLVDEGEQQTEEQFDSVQLGLSNGRTVTIIVISTDRDIGDEVSAFRRSLD